MTTATASIPAPPVQRYTPEDLLAMPDGDAYELVDGELVERNMGWESSWVGGQLHLALGTFCKAHALGWVVPADASYQCFPDAPGKVRRPDISFIRFGRLPGEQRPRGHCRLAPDLVVEVISPNEFYSDVEEKVREYLSAGVRLVWVVNPPTRSIRVHRPGNSITDLGESDELSGEDVIPGFKCVVAELFREPQAAPAPVAPPNAGS